jgi:hypothetical protein
MVFVHFLIPGTQYIFGWKVEVTNGKTAASTPYDEFVFTMSFTPTEVVNAFGESSTE